MNQKTIRDIDVGGKRVLVRVDFNVPLNREGNAVTDDSRIRAALPTLTYLLGKRAKVIVCSHLGHPKDKDSVLSLAPAAERLSQQLHLPVKLAHGCIGSEVEEAARSLFEGQILVLENLRLYPEDERNDPAFAQALAQLADVFVNDAFSMCHRSHASTVGITEHLPSVAGFLLEKEFDTITGVLDSPTRPFTVVIGGRKVSDRMGTIENVMDKIDSLLIGGGLGSAFLKSLAQGVKPLADATDATGLAQELVDQAWRKGVHLLYPLDVVISDKFDPQGKSRTVPIADVPPGWYVMDIGPKTIEVFTAKFRKSKTVIWNGPLGIFEFPKFQKGTRAIATALASSDATTTTIVSGGSIAEAVEEMELTRKLTHVSVAGGAYL
ncbi:MAG: phosphoglycerate kinase, partial [Dehalococcoidia bacterium]|nr:phosphoglycerate kinase [Dehalococcoidia bacterium]